MAADERAAEPRISHKAVTTLCLPYSASGFNHEAHDRWVDKGNCPVVRWTKAWCGRKAGHVGRHGSPVARPDGTRGFEEWDD